MGNIFKYNKPYFYQPFDEEFELEGIYNFIAHPFLFKVKNSDS